jgi:hypothetical protein
VSHVSGDGGLTSYVQIKDVIQIIKSDSHKIDLLIHAASVTLFGEYQKEFNDWFKLKLPNDPPSYSIVFVYYSGYWSKPVPISLCAMVSLL